MKTVINTIITLSSFIAIAGLILYCIILKDDIIWRIPVRKSIQYYFLPLIFSILLVITFFTDSVFKVKIFKLTVIPTMLLTLITTYALIWQVKFFIVCLLKTTAFFPEIFTFFLCLIMTSGNIIRHIAADRKLNVHSHRQEKL